jgi:hypothetical protein
MNAWKPVVNSILNVCCVCDEQFRCTNSKETLGSLTEGKNPTHPNLRPTSRGEEEGDQESQVQGAESTWSSGAGPV